jgi:hypothetical protein
MKLRQSEDYVSKNDMLDTLLDISKEDSQKMDKKQIKHLLLVCIFLPQSPFCFLSQ